MANLLQQSQKTTVDTRKRTADLENTSTEQPRKKHLRAQDQTCEEIEKQSLPRETEFSQARIEFWRRDGTWPTAEQEETISRLRNRVQTARKSFRCKRSYASVSAETISTRPLSEEHAPYRHPGYEHGLKERGSFMGRHQRNISTDNAELCRKLLESPQSLPKDTLFEDGFFEHTLESIGGRNKARIMRDIGLLIVPSAEILAIRGV